MELTGSPSNLFSAVVTANIGGIEVATTISDGPATLKLPEGDVSGNLAAARYLARVNATVDLLGSTPVATGQVEAWCQLTMTLVPLALEGVVESAVPLLRTLANMGVQASKKQANLRDSVATDADLLHSMTSLERHLASNTFLVGDALSLADIAVAGRLYDVFMLFFPIDTREVTYPSTTRWLNHLASMPAFSSALESLNLGVGGVPRAGGQIDLRPNSVLVSSAADLSIARNTGQKKGVTQRQMEKAAAGKKHGKQEAPVAGAGAVEPPAAVATSSAAGLPRGPERVTALLGDLGAAAATEKPEVTPENPAGHATRSLFVKDRKKRYYLITHRQSVKVDLKATATALGTTGFRMGAAADVTRLLCVEPAYVTPVSLVNAEVGTIIPVWDSKLPDSMRMWVGDADTRLAADVPRAGLHAAITACGHEIKDLVV